MDGDTARPIVEDLERGWREVREGALDRRAAKAVDFQLENRAIIALARVMAGDPDALLQRFVDLLIELGGAGFAGVALTEPGAGGEDPCRWRVTAGAMGEASCTLAECGTVAGRGATMHFEGPAGEALATPFPVRGAAGGTVWAIAHGPHGRFDAEDRRRLECLTIFVNDAYHAALAQADLRASEARFRALVTCPGPVVFRADVDGAITDAPGWEALTGQAKSAYQGWGWLEVTHPDDRDASVAAWARSLRTGEPAYMDYRLRDPHGEWRWVRGYGVPVRNEAGAIVEWVGTVTDTHELQQTRAALIENESFHRFAAEAGRTGSWYMRLGSEQVEFSAMAAELFGLPSETVTLDVQAWESHILEEDRQPLRRAMRAAVEAGEGFDVEFRIRRPDGAVRWLYSRGSVARGRDGAPLRLHGATVDLTERKQAQARRLAIAELADGLRDLADADDIGRVAADIIGRTLDVCWVAFGLLEPDGRSIEVRQVWSADPARPAPARIDYGQFAAHEQELGRGEPVAIPASEHGPARATIVYRPLTTASGLPWVLCADAGHRRAWVADDLAFVRDVVERTRLAAERLREEKNLRTLNRTLEREVEARTADFSRLWRNSRDLLLVIDRNGVLRAANPALRSILGWEPEAVVGRPVAELVHPDDHAASRGALSQIGQVDIPAFENRYRHRDGGYRWLSWVAAREDGLIYAAGRHITAERDAKAALEDTQARFRNVFETSYQLRALVGLDGRLAEVNGTALAAIGAPREAVIGMPLWRTPWFTRTPGIPEAVRAAAPRVAAGEVRREDILLDLPAAGWRWLDFTLRPLRDSRGEIVAIVLEAIDITERREAEAALRQSQKLEAMGQLTGGVAHDFNNLLTPIIGGLDMLRRQPSTDVRGQRLIDGALQSAERAKTLVQRLLAFARRQPLQAGPVDVAALIAGMADLIASTSGPQIRVVTDAPPGLPPAQADANQLELAILNLSVNARDAMPDGGTLRIAAALEEVAEAHPCKLSAGLFIRLSVSDTGVGMDEGTLARAIEPFFSTKGQGRGTGLGLSMAHGLASQLGGALDLVSAPGKGAEVRLWLPVSAEAPRATPAAPAAASVPLAAGRALLVDDDLLARASTSAMLADLGFKVTEAASCAEALALLDQGVAVDLLVTDHLMPGMTGAELAREFARRRPGAPVLIVTGYAEILPSDLPHLHKPFRQNDLAASIAALTTPATV